MRREKHAGLGPEILAAKEVVMRQPREVGRVGMILGEVASRHGVSVDDIRSPSRLHGLVMARREAMARIYLETTLSTTRTARAVGRANHTTAINAIRKHIEANHAPHA